MPRIEIELTSARPDGTWTWRAAGAKQPRGTLDAAVLPGGAKVGDVLRAEADIDIDGITVRSTSPVSQKKVAPERIEVIGTARDEPTVTTNMRGGIEAGGNDRGRRGDRDNDRGRDRGGRPGGPGGPGGRGPGGPGRPGGPGGPGGAGGPFRRPEGAGGARPADGADRPRREARPDGAGRPAGDAGRPGRDRPVGDRPAGDRPAGNRPAGERSGAGRPAGDRPPGDRPRRPPTERSERPARPAPRPVETPPKPKARKLQPGRVYRDAVLAELSPERKAVAEQILRGGIPAVRQAVEEQNAQAREVGGPEIKADALLAVAEELLPALRAAEWRDRADAAVGIVDEISVRDLRSVVLGADTARDEEGRALAAQLRETLDRRSAAERQTWVDEITSSLDEGRVVRALRISGRPPEPGVRFPTELAKRLSDASGDALGPDTTPDRWAAVLEAVVASPVRRTITPKGLPAEPGEALARALRLAAPRIPAIAALLGDVPGAPPRRPTRPSTPRGGPGAGAGVGVGVGHTGRPAGRPTMPPPGRPGAPPPPAAPGASEVPSAAPDDPGPADTAMPESPVFDAVPVPGDDHPLPDVELPTTAAGVVASADPTPAAGEPVAEPGAEVLAPVAPTTEEGASSYDAPEASQWGGTASEAPAGVPTEPRSDDSVSVGANDLVAEEPDPSA